MIIREDIGQYMRDLKSWLDETAESGLEEMSDFFAGRLDCYEEHMSLWSEAYRKFAALLPDSCVEILDLGCGTGLELDEIFKRLPNVRVTGVDMCREMLDRLAAKHPGKDLRLVCEDYFRYDMPAEHWDAAISFESLHHFLPGQKLGLYRKIYKALKRGGVFVYGDYIACCGEEEELLRETYLDKRGRSEIEEDSFVHFDIPLTEEHELEVLRKAGFERAEVLDSIDGATLIRAEKSR